MSAMPRSEQPALLILGGTGEARRLSAAAVARFGDDRRVVTSLAGRTRDREAMAGEIRVGGFGGADALADYLCNEGVGWVIDATHPYAAKISANAAAAARAAAIPMSSVSRLFLRTKAAAVEIDPRRAIVRMISNRFLDELGKIEDRRNERRTNE